MLWTTCISITVCVIAELVYFDLFKENLDSNIVKVNAIFLIVLTFTLVCIAWIQLEGINNTARADFLLRLDERFGNDNILKARVIIHELYRKTKPECTHEQHSCSDCNELHFSLIRKEIKLIGRNEALAEKFVYLRNFLDFIETIGYFSHQGHITPHEVNELMGGTLCYHYNVFKDWIAYRKERDKDPSSYCEIEWLYQEIKKLTPVH